MTDTPNEGEGTPETNVEGDNVEGDKVVQAPDGDGDGDGDSDSDSDD